MRRDTCAEILHNAGTAYPGGYRRDTAYHGGKLPGLGVPRPEQSGSIVPLSRQRSRVSAPFSCFARRRAIFLFWRRTKKWMPRVAYHPRKARQTMHGSRFPWMHACAGAAGVDKSSLSWPSFLPFQAITPQPTLLELKRSFVRVGWRRGTWSAIRFSHAVNGLVMPCSHLSPLSQFLLRFYTLNPKP